MIPAFYPKLAISLHQETVNSLDTMEKGNFIQAILHYYQTHMFN